MFIDWCLLCVVCSLIVDDCRVTFVACCLKFVVRELCVVGLVWCVRFVVWCLLCDVCSSCLFESVFVIVCQCMLYDVWCALFVVCCLLCGGRCLLFVVRCSLIVVCCLFRSYCFVVCRLLFVAVGLRVCVAGFLFSSYVMC